jgi:hypothetical protein
LRRNRKLGRQILFIIARYQKTFMEQSFRLGDEGGIFDRLCHSLASMCFALSMDKPEHDYLKVAETLDYEADLAVKGRGVDPELQTRWAEIGRLLMDPNSQLHKDLIADIEVSDIPLDPRFIDKFI